MGGKLSRFTPEEVSIYESCTCLDGAELTTVYEKFIKMGGRRVTKGAMLEESYRRAIGQKTVKNLTAGTAAVALSQVRGDSPAHHSHARAPAPCRRMPSPSGMPHTQRTRTRSLTRKALTRSATFQVETSTDGADDSKTKEVRVRKAKVCDLPEFDNNPLAPRFCEVFSSDGSGDLYFDELLDLFHALSPRPSAK